MYQGEAYQTPSKRWKWRIYYRNGKQYEPKGVSVLTYITKKGAMKSLRSVCTRPIHVVV